MKEAGLTGKKAPVILVIRFSSLGDIVLMLPMLRELRKGFPGGMIHLATKAEYAGLLAGNGDVDHIHTLADNSFASSLSLFKALRKLDFDIVIDAHGVLRSILITAFLSAGMKISIDKEQFKKTLLIKHNINYYKVIRTQAERYLEVATRLGTGSSAQSYLIDIPGNAETKMAAYLEESKIAGMPLIALAPGARWQTKRWPEEHFSELLGGLSEQGYATVLMGDMREFDLCERIKERSSRSVNAAGRFSLIESAALLKKCLLLVTNDSAPLHLAESVGTPVVAFFGPTVREFGFFPRLPGSAVLEIELACRPCSRNGSKKCRYGTKDCLVRITPGDALQASLRTLERAGADRATSGRKA